MMTATQTLFDLPKTVKTQKRSSPHGLWTEELVIWDARRFSSRWEWQKRNNPAYSFAHRNGLLDKCCSHMKRKTDAYTGLGIIYAFRFSDRSAYVGQTINPKVRFENHIKRGPVSKKILSGVRHEYIVLEKCPGSPDARTLREDFWMKWHREDGWSLINSKSAGACGTVSTRWSFRAVSADALKYQTKQEWRKQSPGAYSKALKRKWMSKVCGHMKNGHALREQTRKAAGTTRYALGSKVGSSKLSEEKIEKIKSLRVSGMQVQDIAAMFGVHRDTISRSLNGRSWTGKWRYH